MTISHTEFAPFDDERFWELTPGARANLIYRGITTAQALTDLYMQGGIAALLHTFDDETQKTRLPQNSAEHIERVFKLKQQRVKAFNTWTTPDGKASNET